MERRRKLFRSRRKRSDSEERLYHGNAITLEQESQMTASGGAEAPVLGATTCGPLPGQLRAGAGAWGTINRETRPCLRDDGVSSGGAGTAPMRAVHGGSLAGFAVAAVDGKKRAVRGGSSEDAFAAVADIFKVNERVERQRVGVGPEGQTKFHVGDRIFHLFAVFDGHRSNHAARFCSERLQSILSCELCQAGLFGCWVPMVRRA